MKLLVKKPVKLEDGRHEGKIIAVRYRTKPFDYTDLEISCEGMILKAGYPTMVMVESKLGLLMKRFGIVVAEGLSVDPDKLANRDCEFVTMSKVTGRGTFANIIPDSVKPLSPFVQEEPIGTQMEQVDTRKVGINASQQPTQAQGPGSSQGTQEIPKGNTTP